MASELLQCDLLVSTVQELGNLVQKSSMIGKWGADGLGVYMERVL